MIKQYGMLKTYFKIMWRNLAKNKVFSLINMAGLAIGMATCFIIVLYIQDELSYDRFNEAADRIVRVNFAASINGGNIRESFVMPPVAQALQREFPEVEQATRLRTYGTQKITVGEKHFRQEHFAFADSNFFRVFSLRLENGNPETALLRPNSLVITRETAIRYFGKADAVGMTLLIGGGPAPFTITGVMDKIPSNAHFHFDMLCSMSSLPEAAEQTWLSSNYFTYLLLARGSQYKQLEAKLPGVVKKYMGPQILQSMGMTLEQFRTKGNELGFVLQPLTDIHLHSNGSYELEPGGNPEYLKIFGAVAVFMLLIACINFINLSTAGASKRAKEVGLRKVLGSRRSELIRQFLFESAVLTLLALLLAVVLVQLALPFFNELAGKSLSLGLNPRELFSLLALALLVSLLAGTYPAFFLSSFQPAAVLKSRFVPGKNSISLRSGLVVFQFLVSISFIVGATTVYQQLKYIQHASLGYDRDRLLVISNSWALGKNEMAFKEKLMADSRVENITVSAYKPAGPSNSNNTLLYPDGKEGQLTRVLQYHIDEAYLPTLGIHLATGRNFSRSFGGDSSAIILNQAAVTAFGLGNSPLGHTITEANYQGSQKKDFTVIGVVKDFHFKSLHEAITPLVMVLGTEWGIIMRVKGRDAGGLLATITKEWGDYNPEEPVEYAFMNDLYNSTYITEQKTGRILNVFAFLTVFVACLGLFGLATFTAEQRTREIGVRKVLGASVSQITGMLSLEFIRLVLISCLIALPLSYWLMHLWLQDFAYHIALHWWIFLLAALTAIAMALFTVSFQSIRAATSNPVDSLRTE